MSDTTKKIIFAIVCAILAAAGIGTCACMCGCSPRVRSVAPPYPPEIPVANLPRSLRQTNWVSRHNGQGSCVHASSMTHFRWQGKYELADGWGRRYAGGETAYSILNKWIDNRIPFHMTLEGDPAFLEWATATRRGSIIWYYPSHCCTFMGFAEQGGREYAYLCDNNRTGQFIAIEKQPFIRAWRGFGGFAATACFTPTGPLPWPAYVPR